MVVISENPVLGELAPVCLTFDRLLYSRRSFFICGVGKTFGPTIQAGVIHGYMEGMEAFYETDEKNSSSFMGNRLGSNTDSEKFNDFLCGCDAYRTG